MKTSNRSTRSSRRGLYVGLALSLSAALTLAGVGLWLALDPEYHLTTAGLAAMAGGALVCLAGLALSIASAVRGRSGAGDFSRGAMSASRARSAEEAAALAQAQKMEALGLLAGGVAHDFNNLLHVIRNSVEVLQRQGPEPESARYLEMIRRSGDRAAALTGQLLAFSRRQPVEMHSIDPNDLVGQMAELLRHSLGERITIETVLGRGIWNVAADAGQLETAILNLAINARDAMPQAGLLTIETANATLEESLAAARSARASDPYVMIAVSDTGTGMTPEVVARACEPFFTTKELGQGTGLGLSQVAGFAQQSGGHVRISSEPGKGTTVRVYLPRSPRPEADPVPAKWRAWPIKEATHGTALAVGAGTET